MQHESAADHHNPNRGPPGGSDQPLSTRSTAICTGAIFLLLLGIGLLTGGGIVVGDEEMVGAAMAMFTFGAFAAMSSIACFCVLNHRVNKETRAAAGGAVKPPEARMTTNAPYAGGDTERHGDATATVSVGYHHSQQPAQSEPQREWGMPLPGSGLPAAAPGGAFSQQPMYPPPLYSTQGQHAEPQLPSAAAFGSPSAALGGPFSPPDATASYAYPVYGVPVALPPHQMGYLGQPVLIPQDQYPGR